MSLVINKPTARPLLRFLENQKQLLLSLDGDGDEPEEGVDESRGREKENGIGKGQAAGGEAGAGDTEIGSRRDYSSAQRVYLDQLEQGAYNAYAGGLLFAPLLE